MIQLELYLKEISNFLRTITFKNNFFADHMAEVWVKDKYKQVIQDFPYLHPYYRNITGEYILFDYTTLEKAYGVEPDRYATKEEYLEKSAEITKLAEEKYGLSRMSYVPCLDYEKKRLAGTPITYSWVPNSSIYNYSNDLPIINSFDTQEKIPFTKAILTSTNEINTAEIYKIPNKWYFNLIEKYPKSADIIKAIVYPIEDAVIDGVAYTALDRAVNAKNFELLAYDDSILEENEFQSMHDCVTNVLDVIRKRYAINEFCFEDMYPAAHGYLIWNILYMALFVQRITNIRTGNVHSYHLWSYLKSHGLGEYRDILTQRQQNFLYRNLRYLIEHKGTQHALEILVYVLLTCQNISLQGKDTKQKQIEGNKSPMLETAKKIPSIQSITVGKPMLTGIDDIYHKDPDTRFQDILTYMGIHAGENNENDQEEYESGYEETTEEIYNKERAAGLEYQDNYLFNKSTERHDNLISLSPESYRNTKLLELISNSSSDLYIAMYTKFFAESLIYRIYMGDLKFSITFTPPESSTPVVLPAEEAVGMLFYTVNKANANRMPDTYPSDYDMTGQATDEFVPLNDWYTYDQRTKTYTIDYAAFQNCINKDKILRENYVRVLADNSCTLSADNKVYPVGSKTPLSDDEVITIISNNMSSLIDEYEFVWTKGRRIYKPWIMMNKPPDQYQVEWPYRTEFDGEVKAFPELKDTFIYYQHEMKNKYYLKNIVTSYSLDIFNSTYTFNVVSLTTADISRQWVSTSGYYTLEYYSTKGKWVIRDKINHIFYASEKLDYFTVDIKKLKWYDELGNEVDINATELAIKNVLDINMQNYYGVFHSVTDFAGKIHKQCMDFLGLFLENSSDDSLLYHAIYNQIRDERYVRAVLPIDLLNGKTYTKYLASDDENIVALKSAFDLYDESDATALYYSTCADTIIKALMPIDEALLSSNEIVMNEKYKKIIKLFKSMIAYNLAFIESEYRDIDSTIFRPIKEETINEYILEKYREVDAYLENCRTNFWELFTPNFIGQGSTVTWEKEELRESASETDQDLINKQCVILNHIKDICSILDSNISVKSKKTKLKKLVGTTFLVNYLLNKPLTTILNLGFIVEHVKTETMPDTVRTIDTESEIFKEKVIVFGGHDPTKEQYAFNEYMIKLSKTI